MSISKSPVSMDTIFGRQSPSSLSMSSTSLYLVKKLESHGTENSELISRVATGNPVLFTLSPPECYMEVRYGFGASGTRVGGPVSYNIQFMKTSQSDILRV